MKIAASRWFLITVLTLLLPAFLAQADPLRDIKRTVNGTAINLSPLFHWWTNHQGDRPLAAWVRVHGTVIGTNSGAWVISGKFEKSALRMASGDEAASSSGDEKILLKHPPLASRFEFDQLKAQLKKLTDERSSLSNLGTEAGKEAHQLNAQYAGRRSRVAAQESRSLSLTSKEAKADVKLLDAQIKNVKTKLGAFPDPERFGIDCFALDTGQRSGELPVFDYGVTYK